MPVRVIGPFPSTSPRVASGAAPCSAAAETQTAATRAAKSPYPASPHAPAPPAYRTAAASAPTRSHSAASCHQISPGHVSASTGRPASSSTSSTRHSARLTGDGISDARFFVHPRHHLARRRIHLCRDCLRRRPQPDRPSAARLTAPRQRHILEHIQSPTARCPQHREVSLPLHQQKLPVGRRDPPPRIVHLRHRVHACQLGEHQAASPTCLQRPPRPPAVRRIREHCETSCLLRLPQAIATALPARCTVSASVNRSQAPRAAWAPAQHALFLPVNPRNRTRVRPSEIPAPELPSPSAAGPRSRSPRKRTAQTNRRRSRARSIRRSVIDHDQLPLPAPAQTPAPTAPEATPGMPGSSTSPRPAPAESPSVQTPRLAPSSRAVAVSAPGCTLGRSRSSTQPPESGSPR